MKKSYLYIIFCLVLFSCQKEKLPEPVVIGDPVFDLSFDLDSDLNRFSGNDYFLNTEYKIEDDGLISLSGEYIETNCSSECGPKFQLNFYDIDYRDISDFIIDDLIQERTYEYINYNPTPTPDSLVAQTHFGQVEPSIWFWEDQLTEQVISLNEHVVDLSDYDEVSLSLTAEYEHFLLEMASLNLDAIDLPEICITSDNGCYFITINNIIDEVQMIWSYGSQVIDLSCANQLTITSDMTDIPIDIFIGGIDLLYIMQFEFEFNSLGSEVNVCFNPYSVEYRPGGPGEINRLGKVEMVYTDESGIVYRSGFEPNMIGGVTVSELSEFEQNQNGQRTKKFDVQFNGILVADNGSIINIDNGSGTFSVAYPD